MVQAVIVAAGHGSRLYPITDIVPKSMLPIGEDQLPMIEMIVRHCMKYGITEFVFCLNSENGKQVKNYFGNGSKLCVEIKYSFSDEPLGTSGEIQAAYERGLIHSPSSVLIYYGDTLCNTNLYEMMALDADVSVVVNDLVTIPYGFIQDFDGVAERIIEKPTIQEMVDPILQEMVDRSGKIGYGAIMSVYYVRNKEFFTKYCNFEIDISKDILPAMINDGYKVMAYHDKKPFLDVGNWKNFGDAKTWKT